MEHISVVELKSKLEQGAPLKVLDVREVMEYEEHNINAKLLPLSQLKNFDIDEIENWKEEEVIVHCKSGVRSMEACLILESLGFQNTKNLTGGIMEWKKQFGNLNIDE